MRMRYEAIGRYAFSWVGCIPTMAPRSPASIVAAMVSPKLVSITITTVKSEKSRYLRKKWRDLSVYKMYTAYLLYSRGLRLPEFFYTVAITFVLIWKLTWRPGETPRWDPLGRF